ncbi:MAG: hypothetical protein OEN55_00140 [Alphaproteobacteria bacterium]|nr:hypothetical protein [Alphaproteobacteria bacterium]
MDAKSKQPSGDGQPVLSVVDSRQRRALARLGLASAGAYVAPTLLALRSAPRTADAPGRIVVAA